MTGTVDRDELLTVRQVLDLLGGVSRDTFYEWREKRTAPPCSGCPTAICGSGVVTSSTGSKGCGTRLVGVWPDGRRDDL